MSTIADHLVEQLCVDVAALEADLVGYRELFQLALARVHQLEKTLAVAREQNQALRDELRRYTKSKVSA